jgi:hypothetical protein
MGAARHDIDVLFGQSIGHITQEARSVKCDDFNACSEDSSGG